MFKRIFNRKENASPSTALDEQVMTSTATYQDPLIKNHTWYFHHRNARHYVAAMDAIATKITKYLPERFTAKMFAFYDSHDADTQQCLSGLDGPMYEHKAIFQQLNGLEIIRAIRNIRSEYNVEPGRRIIAHLAAGEHYEMLTLHQEILINLARLDAGQLNLAPTLDKKPEQAVGQVISGGIEIYLPLAGMIDLEAEKERLLKELVQLEQRIVSSQTKLNNQNFVQKAPAEVVERERQRLADIELQATKIRDQLQDLE